jgi:hypothetical protein
MLGVLLRHFTWSVGEAHREIVQDGDRKVSYMNVYGQKSVAISVIEIKRESFMSAK